MADRPTRKTAASGGIIAPLLYQLQISSRSRLLSFGAFDGRGGGFFFVHDAFDRGIAGDERRIGFFESRCLRR